MRLIAVVLLILSLSKATFTQDTIRDERTGVIICFSSAGKIFPTSWYSSKINAKGVSLSRSEYSRSKNIIFSALSKYPPSVIENNLKTVYVLKNIEFFGQSFGGTNSRKIVFLSNKGKEKGYKDFYLEQLFHAEFSSILLRNYGQYFNENQWKKNNSEIEYGKGGVNALKKDLDSERFDRTSNEKGFLNQYAMSDIENDFNSFAKNLFLPKEGFRELIKENKKINNKRKLIIAFYNKVDRTFTEEYFNQILNTTKTKQP